MGLTDDAEGIAQRLQDIKERHGEAAYKDACRDLARQFLNMPQGDALISKFFPDLDIDELRAGDSPQVKPPDTPTMPDFGSPPGADQAMLQMLSAQIPSLKTQAQFNTFMGCFDSLRVTLDGYFGGNVAAAEMGRSTLNQALDLAKRVSDMSQKLDEIPDEAKSESAKDFMKPAKELHEYDEAKALMGELEGISDGVALQKWYDANRERLDRIVTVDLRNELFDAIRAKRAAKGAN